MTEPEFYYEWGWVARFEDGEEWDSNDGLVEDVARHAVEHGNADEEYMQEIQLDPETTRVFYALRKRKVSKPGPWEEVK